MSIIKNIINRVEENEKKRFIEKCLKYRNYEGLPYEEEDLTEYGFDIVKEKLLEVNFIERDEDIIKVDLVYGDSILNSDEIVIDTSKIEEMERICVDLRRLVNYMFLNPDKCCKRCDEVLYFQSDFLKIKSKESLFYNQICSDCEKWIDTTCYKLYLLQKNVEDLECEICHFKMIEIKENEDKITWNINLSESICCKEKIICDKCLEKCDRKCPFCRQDKKFQGFSPCLHH